MTSVFNQSNIKKWGAIALVTIAVGVLAGPPAGLAAAGVMTWASD